MINVQLPDLNKDNLYNKVLDLLEKLCDQYSLLLDFGTLSMANQLIIDYLNAQERDFSVDFNCFIENDKFSFSYSSSVPIFKHWKEFDTRSVLSILAENIEYQSDYKQISFLVHVKPKKERKRLVNRTIIINQPIS